MGDFLLIIGIIIIVGIIGGIISFISESKKMETGRNLVEKKYNSILSAIPNFKESISIIDLDEKTAFYVDETSRKICFIQGYEYKLIEYEKIIRVQLIEDGETKYSKSTLRTIGGALVGNVIAGETGAIIGGLSGDTKVKKIVKMITIELKLRDINDSTYVFNVFNADQTSFSFCLNGLKTDDDFYSTHYMANAKKIIDTLEVIIDDVDKKNNSESKNEQKSSDFSIADELKKLSDLKNQGIITQEEYDQQKAKLLSK